MFLVAPHVIPVEGPNHSPGAIRVEGDRIVEIGDPAALRPAPGEEIRELPDTVLTPAFVNAHCHLELTALGTVEVSCRKNGISFADWIRDVIRQKDSLAPSVMASGIERGIKKLLASGVATIGDHISFNTEWETIVRSPLKGRLFGEVLGILPEVCDDIYNGLRKIKSEFDTASSQSALHASRFTLHVTPHSVHAVHPDTVKRIGEREPGPFSIHLAESREEEDYFGKQTGALTELIAERGLTSLHKGVSAIDCLRKIGFPLSRVTVVHGNYLTDAEIALLKEARACLVHCPGSHAYFGHRPFPLKEYLDFGLRMAIGTDSIASNTDLDFLLELRRIRELHPSVSPREILSMATLGGARALRMERKTGSLVPGKRADIAGFHLTNGLTPEDSIFAASHASFLMIDGRKLQGPTFQTGSVKSQPISTAAQRGEKQARRKGRS